MSKLVDSCVCQLQAPAGLRPTPELPVGPPATPIRPGLTNLWHAGPTRHAERSFAHDIHGCPIFFLIFFQRRIFISSRTCVYIHISDCLGIVYELPLLPNNTASEVFLHRSGAVLSVD